MNGLGGGIVGFGRPIGPKICRSKYTSLGTCFRRWPPRYTYASDISTTLLAPLHVLLKTRAHSKLQWVAKVSASRSRLRSPSCGTAIRIHARRERHEALDRIRGAYAKVPQWLHIFMHTEVHSMNKTKAAGSTFETRAHMRIFGRRAVHSNFARTRTVRI